MEDFHAIRKAAMKGVFPQMKTSRRTFMMGTACDPILALACQPMRSTIPALAPSARPKKRRR